MRIIVYPYLLKVLIDFIDNSMHSSYSAFLENAFTKYSKYPPRTTTISTRLSAISACGLRFPSAANTLSALFAE